MSCISLDVEGAKDLIKALEKAEKRFPASAEAVLKSEAKTASKDIKKRTGEEAKGHGKKPGTLKKSFRPGKVMKRGSNYTTAVTTTAPHYHLFEEGHELYAHNRKNKKGRGKPGTGQKIGHVEGRKTVARYMAQRSDDSEKIGMRLLDEILKDAGLE